MRGLAKRTVRADRGAEAVEFAVIVPVLLALLTAFITFGFTFNAQVTITQAAREGARYAAICNKDTTCLSGVTGKTENAAYGLTITDSQVSIVDCTSSTSATVTIKYLVNLGIPPFTAGLTITGKASTPCGG
jgi:Flp pilus assembly protein TadG